MMDECIKQALKRSAYREWSSRGINNNIILGYHSSFESSIILYDITKYYIGYRLGELKYVYIGFETQQFNKEIVDKNYDYKMFMSLFLSYRPASTFQLKCLFIDETMHNWEYLKFVDTVFKPYMLEEIFYE
jgi:hypothetical protein